MEKNYEIGYLLSPLVPAEEVGIRLAEAIKEPLSASHGVVTSELEPRSITLAYPVSKTENHQKTTFKEAYFGALRIAIDSAEAVALAEKLKLSPLVIRFVLISLPKNAAPMMPLKRPMIRRRPASSQPAVKADEAAGEKKPEMTSAEIDKEIEGLLVEAA